MNLKNKKIIINGGTHGIGKNTAMVFKEFGTDILVIRRNEEKGNEIMKAKGEGKVTFYKCDLTKRDETVRLCKFIDNAENPYNILINCASRNSRYNI